MHVLLKLRSTMWLIQIQSSTKCVVWGLPQMKQFRNLDNFISRMAWNLSTTMNVGSNLGLLNY